MDKTEDQIWQDIKRARVWALKHFNANPDGSPKSSTLLDPPTFYVEFTDVDRMRVTPCFYNTKGILGVNYRLAFTPSGLEWRGAWQTFTGIKRVALKIDQRN